MCRVSIIVGSGSSKYRELAQRIYSSFIKLIFSWCEIKFSWALTMSLELRQHQCMITDAVTVSKMEMCSLDSGLPEKASLYAPIIRTPKFLHRSQLEGWCFIGNEFHLAWLATWEDVNCYRSYTCIWQNRLLCINWKGVWFLVVQNASDPCWVPCVAQIS
jgi:hypothetical protein